MSFIHDALKKSDRARRLLGASRAEPADATLLPKPRVRWLPWVIALLAANLALLAWFTLRPVAPSGPTEATPASAPYPGGVVRSLAREAGNAPAANGAPTVPANAGANAGAGAATTEYESLPADLRARLPALQVDAHAWSEDPAQRFVIINLKRRVVGDRLDGGVTLLEITIDGVVIEFEGRRAFIARQ